MNDEYEVRLPRLVGTREAAGRLLDDAQLPDDLANGTVILRARGLSSSTASFTDELLKQLLERHTSRVLVVGAPKTFEADVERVQARRDLTGLQVSFGSQQDLLAL